MQPNSRGRRTKRGNRQKEGSEPQDTPALITLCAVAKTIIYTGALYSQERSQYNNPFTDGDGQHRIGWFFAV